MVNGLYGHHKTPSGRIKSLRHNLNVKTKKLCVFNTLLDVIQNMLWKF
jgi:hypothetical protein